ncbi:C-type isolectin Sp-CL4-like [Epinephelus lanceolatus]|uniref:alpha-N-acetylgalactosamine-specific lectin-like n=1 Tax=Epinephelus lanceolatus TaxID=310571 RepID=UPI00144875E6|nr:alpha-N-acetylgalactosamine-specific lectin-like [Epinephelus lanceolatus]
MRSAVVSAVILLLVLVHIQDSLSNSVRTMCLQKYSPRPCGGGWIRVTGNKCVKYFRLSKTFWEAQSHCAGQGGHLASIHNTDENGHVMCLSVSTPKKSPTSNDYFWIGGRSSAPLSGYGWTDKSAFGFTKWHPGQPVNRASHTCVAMNYKHWGDWTNIDCNSKKNFVCVR